MGFLLYIAPLMAVILYIIVKKRSLLHIVSIGVSLLTMILALLLTGDVIINGKIESSNYGGFFYVDPLSIIILNIVLIIGFFAAIYSIQYLETDFKRGILDLRRIKIYYVLMYLFMFTMILALTVKNMGIMWIAIEATTLASVFLVGFHNDKFALEAAWKYIIICSVGIAIAMLGIILLHLSSIGVMDTSGLLDWTALMENAINLKSSAVRLAFIFILVGFGTKAGLAPMHTWLPDAHSQAPAPISALLSGVLLNSAMYGIIRMTAIVNKNLGDSVYTGRLLITIGMLSIVTAAIFILTQKDYKRLLAYSSIEHMGIIAVAIGFFTPLAIIGGILHMINHSFTKSMLFLCSGSILQKYNTKHIAKVKSVLKLLPFTGTAFLIGLFAIAGTPPFSVFASEFGILISIFNEGNYLVGAALALLFALIFAGIAVALFRIFYGKADQNIKPGEINTVGAVVVIILLLIISITGLAMPKTIIDLITEAQIIISGA
ncbi:MAG TPA: proton-conducting transporter membrane subunit [Anaerovoracaceae bacterium]|nr:proton-conducting transporter membrane subunit [Anaerovoracaceae bacterium]